MGNTRFVELLAYARVTAGTGASTSAMNCATGRSGAGVYTVTLDQPADEEECHVSVEVQTAAIDDTPQVVHTSDTIKTINTFDGGVATDCDFSVLVWKVSPR